jgi:hypothetical protein
VRVPAPVPAARARVRVVEDRIFDLEADFSYFAE